MSTQGHTSRTHPGAELPWCPVLVVLPAGQPDPGRARRGRVSLVWPSLDPGAPREMLRPGSRGCGARGRAAPASRLCPRFSGLGLGAPLADMPPALCPLFTHRGLYRDVHQTPCVPVRTPCELSAGLAPAPRWPAGRPLTLALPRKSTGSRCSRYRLRGRKTSPRGTHRGCRGTCFWGSRPMQTLV